MNYEPLLTRGLPPRNSSRHLIVTKASRLVIVHHADGLHERIADGRTNELETAAEEITAERIRFRRVRLCRRTAFALDGSLLHESPDLFIETPKLFLDLKENFGIQHRGIDLQTIPDNAGVAE